ncbi:MAG: hypothetical protein FJZ92_13375 [Chloroflexi bacterium]|nr:hypothetical protein [Chloroflexota bacterium]
MTCATQTGWSHALWDGARPEAERCLAHPFVRGLADGTIDPARYRDFIAQDAYFLEVSGRARARRPSRRGSRRARRSPRDSARARVSGRSAPSRPTRWTASARGGAGSTRNDRPPRALPAARARRG